MLSTKDLKNLVALEAESRKPGRPLTDCFNLTRELNRLSREELRQLAAYRMARRSA